METRPTSILVQLLRTGFRFCGSCGKLKIEPDSPEWMRQCGECYATKESIKHCGNCGEEIEQRGRLWALRNNRQPRWCFFCRHGATKPCPGCGLVHPASWKHESIPAGLASPSA